MLDQEMLHDPEFSPWVSGLPDDDYAYCKFCKKELLVNGKSSLRAHARGIKHTKLMRVSQRGRATASRPRPATKKSSNPVRPSKGPSQKSSVAGINFAFFNNLPSSSTAPSMGVHQIMNRNPYQRDRTPNRTRHSPRLPYHPGASFEDDINHREGARANEFVEKAEMMLSQHVAFIREDASDFLDLYGKFLAQRVFPSTSSSHLDRYSSVKNTLEEYKQQHDALRKKIKTRLVSLL